MGEFCDETSASVETLKAYEGFSVPSFGCGSFAQRRHGGTSIAGESGGTFGPAEHSDHCLVLHGVTVGAPEEGQKLPWALPRRCRQCLVVSRRDAGKYSRGWINEEEKLAYESAEGFFPFFSFFFLLFFNLKKDLSPPNLFDFDSGVLSHTWVGSMRQRRCRI